ncbi:MAG: hypothetical protein WBR11_07640 [Terriglobales bacterium]
MMKFKPKSEFNRLGLSLVLLLVLLHVGGRLGWWPHLTTPGIVGLFLAWILMALIEIGKVLERISPPEQESDEYLG